MAVPAALGLHVAARMLLAGDGSTTVMLEAMLNRPLSVSVSLQHHVDARQAPPQAVAALGLGRGHSVIERHSALVTDQDDVVSRNLVVFPAPPRGWTAAADDPTPLGHRLRAARTLQHRRLLGSGSDRWAPHDERCLYKEYLIHSEDGARLYVHERFNPRYVPLPDSL
ncbi:hypothetical protein ACFRAR_22670 [Kitasatospora sp. NPDC056651]|uniref:hypothetical protein n=1 Tax=Kitasatospora sp. NPDC056651 TaxID=3345892 RepID=UPI0036923DA0